MEKTALVPSRLVTAYWPLLKRLAPEGPILDLACGEGRNGIFLASKGFDVTCSDISSHALKGARALAALHDVHITTWQMDFETGGIQPLGPQLEARAYSAALVFRYLHRPLIPSIKDAVKRGGFVLYETFTVRQPAYGKPHNPLYLLEHGELLSWFRTWHVVHYFEGVARAPRRAVAGIVCRKPFKERGP